MKRKLFAVLLAALLALGTAFCFVGCGEENGSASTPPSPSSPSDTPPDDEPKPETPEEPSTPEEPEEETPETPEEPEENPDDTPVDPPEESFSLAENREKILENVMPLIKYYKRNELGNSPTIDEVYDIYLTKSENSQIIDTLGIIFSGTTSAQGYYLDYGTITIPTTQNLDYVLLSKNQQTNTTNLKLKPIYHFGVSPSSKRYADTIEKIQRKIFENYDDALWLGWNGTNYPQYDGHQVVCYDGRYIHEIWITIKNDGCTLPFPNGAVEKYLLNDSYTVRNESKVIEIKVKTLNDYINEEIFEQAQQG